MAEELASLTGQNQVEGTVSAVLFRNEENGYTVLRLDCGEKGEITAVGCMPGVCRWGRRRYSSTWPPGW